MQIVKFKTGVLFNGYKVKLPGHSHGCPGTLKVRCNHCVHVCYLTGWVSLRFLYVPNKILLKSIKL